MREHGTDPTAQPHAETPSVRGASARRAYVVLLYGASWAHLLARLAGRLGQLQAGRGCGVFFSTGCH